MSLLDVPTVAGVLSLADTTNEPFTVGWWLARLDAELTARLPYLTRMTNYYEGHHALSYAGAKWRQSFGGLFSRFADNWCSLVVDAVTERLRVEGFRMTENPEGDADAWEMWQRNYLDHDSNLVHTDALVTSSGYLIVWPDDDGYPRISVESGGEVVVAYAADSRRTRVAALKRWTDELGIINATLYLPDAIYKFATGPGGRYLPREAVTEQWPVPNPLGVVPVIELTNRPRLWSPTGLSEVENVIPQQDAINKLLADMLVASEFAAFRQRWATGLEVPVDPVTGTPIEPFKAAVDRLWIAEDPGARFGEFNPTDLTNYVTAVEMLVQHIAAQSSTPPHYFYLKGQFPSGESIKSAEASLVAKVHQRMRVFEEGWEEAIRLGFAILDDERANAWSAETIWGDPEYRTEGEHVDALTKLKSINVPDAQLWEDAGYTPQQIARFKAMRAEEALNVALAAPVFGVPTGPGTSPSLATVGPPVPAGGAQPAAPLPS